MGYLLNNKCQNFFYYFTPSPGHKTSFCFMEKKRERRVNEYKWNNLLTYPWSFVRDFFGREEKSFYHTFHILILFAFWCMKDACHNLEQKKSFKLIKESLSNSVDITMPRTSTKRDLKWDRHIRKNKERKGIQSNSKNPCRKQDLFHFLTKKVVAQGFLSCWTFHVRKILLLGPVFNVHASGRSHVIQPFNRNTFSDVWVVSKHGSLDITQKRGILLLGPVFQSNFCISWWWS